jgi:hypothetical protein
MIELAAALVLQGYPAHEVERVAGFGGDDVVIGAPGEAAGNVAQLGVEFGGLRGVEYPIERGFENAVVAEGGEDGLPRQGKLQLSPDLDERLRRALIYLISIAVWVLEGTGQVAAAHDFAGHNAIGSVGILHQELNGLALVQAEQLLLRDGVVAVVLLRYLDEPSPGGVAQNDRIGLHLRGDAGETDGVGADVQIEWHGFAHDGEVLVVDG